MKVQDNLVLDSRTMHLHDTPFQTAKILLTVQPEVGAKRMHEENPEKYPSLAHALRASQERLNVERERYHFRYGVQNFLDPKYFDIVLDTSVMTPQEVLENIIQNLKTHGIAN
jgi:cytidylate kinase